MTEKRIFYKRPMFWGVCGVPSLVAAFYLFAWATPRYESESVVRVYSLSSSDSGSAGASSGLGSSASPGSYIFKEIVGSWDCFKALDPHKLANEWEQGDLLSRFGGTKTLFSTNMMHLWDYYRTHVSASIDENSGLVHINVDGYSPQFSYDTNRAALEFARKQLRATTLRTYQVERDQLENKVAQDRERLVRDLTKMEAFHKQYGIADYDSSYGKTLELINHFQQARISLDTKAAATQFFAQRSQELTMLHAQLAALDRNIDRQRAYISQHLAPIYGQFSALKQAVSEDINIIQLDDQNIQDADQLAYRSSYHVDIVEDSVPPSNSTMPRALYWSLVILAITFVAYLIVK